MERHHVIKISSKGGYHVFKRFGMNVQPRITKKADPFKPIVMKSSYRATIQLDVKFLKFEKPDIRGLTIPIYGDR